MPEEEEDDDDDAVAFVGVEEELGERELLFRVAFLEVEETSELVELPVFCIEFCFIELD